jgi:hypothetical protein
MTDPHPPISAPPGRTEQPRPVAASTRSPRTAPVVAAVGLGLDAAVADFRAAEQSLRRIAEDARQLQHASAAAAQAERSLQQAAAAVTAAAEALAGAAEQWAATAAVLGEATAVVRAVDPAAVSTQLAAQRQLLTRVSGLLVGTVLLSAVAAVAVVVEVLR